MSIPVLDLGSVSETGMPFRFRDFVFGVGNNTLRVPNNSGPRCTWSGGQLQCSQSSAVQSFLLEQANDTFNAVSKIPVVGAVVSDLLGWAAAEGRRNGERAAREAFRRARREAAVQAGYAYYAAIVRWLARMGYAPLVSLLASDAYLRSSVSPWSEHYKAAFADRLGFWRDEVPALQELGWQFAFGPIPMRPADDSNPPVGAELRRRQDNRIGVPTLLQMPLPEALTAQIRELAGPYFGGDSEETAYGTPAGWISAQSKQWRSVLMLSVAGPKNPRDGLVAIEDTFAPELYKLRAEGQIRASRDNLVRAVVAAQNGELSQNMLDAIAQQGGAPSPGSSGTAATAGAAPATGMSTGAKFAIGAGAFGTLAALTVVFSRRSKKRRRR